jgi:hypothetical protein
MRTIDLRRELRRFYSPRSGTVELLDVPAFQFVAIDGQVGPGEQPGSSTEFQAAVAALYGAAYTLKFGLKRRLVDPVDFPVMPLEGLWASELGTFDPSRREPWGFTLMILVPADVSAADLEAAVASVRAKRGDAPALARLRLNTFREGRCVQALHVGPYATEPETMARMRAFAADQGCTLGGPHHEIYLGDPRRADPARLRTVLRQPVTCAADERAAATGSSTSSSWTLSP